MSLYALCAKRRKPMQENAAYSEDRLSVRNLLMFSLGTVGRDFLYCLFNSYLLTYILFTKQLTDAQFASVSIIIIVARIFDAFNDPLMGGIVENTHTKFGKFKPWMTIGALLTAVVVIAVFSTSLQGWGFIGFLAVVYFLFSITFTMNDISYWGMLPSLTTNDHDRNKLTSFSNIFASVGIGLSSVIIPACTAGQFTLGGSAVKAYMYIAIVAAIIMVGFQMFTVFGVKEKPLPVYKIKQPTLKLKDMFKIIVKNDQLMWCALILLIFNVGTNVVGGGLSMSYIYFEFGYNGMLITVFGILFAVTSTAFTLFFPWLSKKFGRKKLLFSATAAMSIGYGLMLIGGLLPIPSNLWLVKFAIMMIANGIVGWGQGFYMIMVINIANTVEYNEWKTGNRDEGLIFSIRPFTAKMGSALMQFIVMLVYLAVGVTKFTNGISELENSAARGDITDEAKLEGIQAILNQIPQGKKIALLVCMCVIPTVAIIGSYIIFRKKFILDEETHAKMVADIVARNKAMELEGAQIGAEGESEACINGEADTVAIIENDLPQEIAATETDDELSND